jgi:hypothetical protein
MGKIAKSIAAPSKGLTGAAGSGLGSFASGNLFGAASNLGLNTGNFKDKLFGSDQGTLGADPIAADVRRTQLQALLAQQDALSRITELSKEDPTKLVESQVGLERQALQGGADDARRSLQQTIARQGLQGSSIGLGQQNMLTQRLGEQSNLLQASIPDRVRQLREQRAQALLGASTQVLGSQNAPIRFYDEKLGKKGGLFQPLATIGGAILGGSAGGAQGSYAGAQTGSILGGLGS